MSQTKDQTDTANWHVISIAYPISLAISGTLIQAIGTVWPDAVIDTTTPHHLTLRVPRDHDPRVSKKALGKVRSEHRQRAKEAVDFMDDVSVERFDGETLTMTTPEDAMRNLAEWGLIGLTAAPEAVNYIEQMATLSAAVKGHDGKMHRTLAIAACWSREQTPHALRKEAERRAEAAEAEVDRLRALLEEHGIEGGRL